MKNEQAFEQGNTAISMACRLKELLKTFRSGRLLSCAVRLAGEDAGEEDFATACLGRREQGLFDWFSGYLPYDNANRHVLEHFVPQTFAVPLLAGLCATDPFHEHGILLDAVRSRGFAGVQNYPSVGMIDSSFRATLEQQHFGFEREVHLIQQAHAEGLITFPLVFDLEQAHMMLEAGADALALHPGAAALEQPGGALNRCQSFLAEVSEVFPESVPLFCCLPLRRDPMAHSLLKYHGIYA